MVRPEAAPTLTFALLVCGISAAGAAEWPDLPVRSATLSNGLQVIALERSGSSTVALYLHFKVGTVDETPGGLGLSHMLEHMLFKGTRRLGTRDWAREAPILEEIDRVGVELDSERARGDAADGGRIARLEERLEEMHGKQRPYVIRDELTDLLQRAGADPVNASTWADATNYFSVMPAGREEVWLAAFAEQLARPVLREFYPEREVVMEERRMATEDDAGGSVLELAAATAFLSHPYRNTDWMPELRRLTRADAKRHFKTYYGAGNAVLAAAGDFRFEGLMRLAERHLGRLPRRPAPPEVRAVEPPQRGERSAVLEFDARPRLAILHHIPAMRHPDEAALALLSSVLGGHGVSVALESGRFGSSEAARWSRLHRRLVDERGVAQEVEVQGFPGDRYPRALVIGAEPRETHDLADLEAAVLKEIGALQAEGVSAAELARARRNLEALYVSQLETNLGAAWLLGFVHGVSGDWKALGRYVEALEKVQPADVQRVARTYLTEKNRTVVWQTEAGAAPAHKGAEAGGAP
jgi:predicted Zn-dependent peptidase